MKITTAKKLYGIEHEVYCGGSRCEVDIVSLGIVNKDVKKKK